MRYRNGIFSSTTLSYGPRDDAMRSAQWHIDNQSEPEPLEYRKCIQCGTEMEVYRYPHKCECGQWHGDKRGIEE